VTGSAAGAWRPTHAHLRAVAAALGCVVAATVGSRPDLAVLGAPFLALAAWGQLHRPRTDVTCSLRVEARTMFEGQSTVATVRITPIDESEPPGDLVAAALDTGAWIDATPPAGITAVTAPGPAEVEVPLRALRWGRYEVAVSRAACTSRFGAFRAETLPPGPFSVTTLPIGADFAAVDIVPRPRGTVGLHRSHRHGEGSEPAEVRAYRPGDRLRRINWAVSSRTGALHVTSTWSDRDTQVLLLLDTEYDIGESEGVDGAASSLDTAVRAAAAIAEHSLRAGDRVQVIDLGRRVRDVRPGSGLRHLRHVMEVLSSAEVAPNHRAEPVRIRPLSGGAMVIVLSPLVGRLALAQIVHLVQHGHTVIVVDTLPAEPSLSLPRMRALATRLRALERAVEIDRLGELGVPVVPWRGRGTLDEVLRDVSRLALAPRRR
jgi:uncharacterized protein (DUF58 family)